MSRIGKGAVVATQELVAVSGERVQLPGASLVHLQFRRFAGCPVCNLHLRSFARRHGEIAAAGVREVALFHAPEEVLRPFVNDLPFAVVADPQKKLYRAFGVEASLRALLDPRVWPVILVAIVAALAGVFRRGKPVPSLNPYGGRWGLPADFLIAPDGTVLACKYGAHAADHWSVDEVLALAATARPARQAPPAPTPALRPAHPASHSRAR